MRDRHSVLREGLITGVLGATAVAVWFLIVDTIAGAPFFTPRALGAGLFRVDATQVSAAGEVLLITGYTLFHYLAFVAVGSLAVVIVHLGERQPAVLVLFLILFVVFQMGFYGLVAVLHQVELLDGLEWYQIAVGNLLASVLMGGYLWRGHPALRPGLSDALSH